ncbi:MAG: HlyD family efflux transporter periplasmic adaptor subunit [Planctomycetota bacterium]
MRAQTLLLWLVCIIAAMFISAFLLLFLFKINIVAQGYGEIGPAKHVSIKLEPQSVITEIIRRSGFVKEDEIILRMNRSTAERELARAEKQITVLEAQLAALKTKAAEREKQAKAKIAKAQAELAHAQARIEELKKSPLAEEIAASEEQLKQEEIEMRAAKTILDDTKKLYEQGLVSKVEHDEKQKEYDLGVSQVEEKRNQLERLRTKLRRDDLEQAKAEELRAKAELDLAKIIESSKEEIRALEAGIEKAKIERDMCAHDLDLRDFRAPIAGELVGLDDIAPGERILPSSPPIGEIVDRSAAIFKAMIPEVNIPDVRVGQKAILYIDAYPYRKFREFEGEVIEISPVAQRVVGRHGNTPVCEVLIRMDTVPGYEFKPGMAGEAEIIVGRDRAIKWILGIEDVRLPDRKEGSER